MANVDIVPEKIKNNNISLDFGEIFSNSFSNFKGVAVMGFLGTLIYFTLYIILFFLVLTLFGISSAYLEFFNSIQGGQDPMMALEFLEEEMNGSNTFLIGIVSSLAYSLISPLVAGYVNLAKVYDETESVSFGDFFIGFTGNRFIHLFLLFFIFNLAFSFTGIVLYAPVVFFLTPLLILGSPLILYHSNTVISSINNSAKIMTAKWDNFFITMGINLVMKIILGIGFILCIIPGLIILPVTGSMVYFIYKALVVENINQQSEIDEIGL